MKLFKAKKCEPISYPDACISNCEGHKTGALSSLHASSPYVFAVIHTGESVYPRLCSQSMFIVPATEWRGWGSDSGAAALEPHSFHMVGC